MRLLAFSLLAFSLSSGGFAAQDAIGDDGRELRLNDDGSWAYRSTDRFATTAEGKRVRLKNDGSWVFTDKKPLPVPGSTFRADQKLVVEKSLEVLVSDFVVETWRGKKSASQKNTRKKTRMIFTISVMLKKSAGDSLALTVANSDVSIVDSDGREYAITSVEWQASMLKPGEETLLLVRADGSPHWFTTESMTLSMAKQLLGSEKNIVLTRLMSSAKHKSVDSF